MASMLHAIRRASKDKNEDGVAQDQLKDSKDLKVCVVFLVGGCHFIFVYVWTI